MDIAFLHSVAFLKELSIDELISFASLLQTRVVIGGEAILEEGGEATGIYIVCKGTVHAKRRAQKHNVLLGRLGEGAFFGEMNLFDSGIASATVMPTKKAVLAYVSHTALRAFMESNPAAGYKITSSLLREVSRRLRLTNERLVHSVFWNSGEPGE